MALDKRPKADPLLFQGRIANPDGTPTAEFMRVWLAQRGVNGLTEAEVAAAIAAAEAAVAAVNALASVQIGGNGLSIAPGPAPLGNGNITLSLTDTTVTPGVYGDASNVPQFEVDQQGRVLSVLNVPISTGGGGISVSYNGGTPIPDVEQLNFTGDGVSVINDGSGQVTIDIPAGGGGSTPSLVQVKGAVLADPSAGLTLDTAPVEGNLLVAYIGRASTASIAVGAGWTEVDTATSTGLYVKRAGSSESATQTPTSGSLIAGVVIWEFADARGIDMTTVAITRTNTGTVSLSYVTSPAAGYVVAAAHRAENTTPTITGDGAPGDTDTVSSPSALSVSWVDFAAAANTAYATSVSYSGSVNTGRATIRVV